jgi:predicted NUDIX family NTP pyrophosphohydrolase
MTVDERITIASLNFNSMWYKVYQYNPDYTANKPKHRNNFDRCRRLFEEKFISPDNGRYLLQLIYHQSEIKMNNSSLLWEIPKGYSQKNEDLIACSVREFMEETHMSREKFRVLAGPPVSFIYIGDNGTKYKTEYVLAATTTAGSSGINKITMQNFQEICDMRWMSLGDIKTFAPHLLELAARIIKQYKERTYIGWAGSSLLDAL